MTDATPESAISEERLAEDLRSLATSLKRPGGKESRITKACTRAAAELDDLRARLAAAEGRAVAALEEAQAIVLSMIFMPGVRAALENLPPDDPVEPYLELAKKALTATARVAELEGALKRIAFLRPPGPTKNKLIEEMERIAIDARAGRALGGSNG
jgi:hypothetical protein